MLASGPSAGLSAGWRPTPHGLSRHPALVEHSTKGLAPICRASGPLFLTALALRQRRRLAATQRERQVLPFTDPSTGCEVVLVACMHFNPQSVSKAADVTRQLAQRGELQALVVESCPSRWKKIKELQPPGSTLRSLLDNEFQAAADIADSFGKPVVLGDQRIEVVSEEVGSLAQVALTDLFSPIGGWQRTGSELMQGFVRLGNLRREARRDGQDGGDYIGVPDLLDLGLLLGTPVAVLRYVASLALKAPNIFAVVAGYVTAAAVLPDNILTQVLYFTSEVVLLRVLLGALLRERDAVLARSLREVCEAAKQQAGGSSASVVVVLGAAHCNGVKRLMEAETEPIGIA